MTVDSFTRSIARQVLYQVFPDRFAIGGGLSCEQKLATPAYELPGVQKQDWNVPVSHEPGGGRFFGGDLDGIADRIDYLVDLGVTGVYTTPIFQSPSNHKYDATDFFRVDPMFGGDAAFDRLLTALHDRGLKLILDAVLNHVSDQHPWFSKARAGDPVYRDYFSHSVDGSQQYWQDFRSLPELNLASEVLRDKLYRQPDSLVHHWLARGIDGWRFDVAQDVGIPVAEELAGIIGKSFPQAWLIGELCGFGGSWLEGGRGFHGMMNYYHRTALLSWLSGDIDARQMNRAVADMRQGYGLKGLLRSWNMLSSHDTPRLRTALGDIGKSRLAQLAQMTLPGVPLIYYGEEIGMEGGADPDNRQPMRWGESDWDHGQRQWVKSLIAIRQNNPALQYGDVMVLGDRLDGNALVFLRHTDQPGEAALVVINLSGQVLRAKLLLPYSHWYDGVPLRDALGQAPETRVHGGSVQLEVAPGAGAIYEAWEPYEHYRCFKPRNRT